MGGVLPRQVLYLADEFGNYPPIRDIEALFSALRSRRARLLISLQGDSQIDIRIDEQRAITIESNCMIFMFSALAPSASQTAKRISEILGNETIMTGSKSISKGVTTTNTSLAGRPLLTPSQLVRLPWGTIYRAENRICPLYCSHAAIQRLSQVRGRTAGSTPFSQVFFGAFRFSSHDRSSSQRASLSS